MSLPGERSSHSLAIVAPTRVCSAYAISAAAIVFSAFGFLVLSGATRRGSSPTFKGAAGLLSTILEELGGAPMTQETERRRRAVELSIVLIFVGAYPRAVSASDGQIELNQAQAIATGSYQTLVISEPGSYKLTSNLDAASDTNGIVINVGDVTLDLNGFTIEGRGSGGLAYGIVSFSSNVRVHNGTVRDFPSDCVNLGSSSRVENLSAISCAQDGIRLNFSGRVRRSSAIMNGLVGISTNNGGFVEDSEASGNTGIQISLGDSSYVTRCEADAGASPGGIVVGDRAVVSDNIVGAQNLAGVIAISAGDGAKISGNAIEAPSGLGGTGIVTGDGSVVETNTIRSFTTGLVAGRGTVVRGNSFAGLGVPDPNGFGINASGSDALVVENNSFYKFTVGVNSGSNSRIAGNTLRASGFAGSIGLINSGLSDSTAISGNVLNNFTTNLQGPFVTTGVNLYDGSTVP
jgi:hypothetical protein